MEHTQKRQTISLIAPMYNEAEMIGFFYDTILQTFEGKSFDWEIVCVDDGSKDSTLKQLKDLHAKDPRVKYISFSRNFGKEIAMTAGLDYASGDFIIPIDADLQDPPELIFSMIEKLEEGYDVVYATRKVREGESFIKKITAKIFYKIIGSITNFPIPPDTGDFRVMRKEVLQAIQTVKEKRRFMKGMFSWVGFNQVGILYERKPRYAGTTKWNYWKLWNFAIEGITSFTTIPLRVWSYLGAFISLSAFSYAIFLIIRRLYKGIDVPGYNSMMVVILFLGGIQLISLGVIGEYIARIFDEVKERPLYIVKESKGFLGK